MTRTPPRVSKLYDNLTPNERVRLVYRAAVEGKDEEREIQDSIPPHQAAEFRRLVGAAVCIFRVILPEIQRLDLFLECESLRLSAARSYVMLNEQKQSDNEGDLLEREEEDTGPGLMVNIAVNRTRQAFDRYFTLDIVLNELLDEIGMGFLLPSASEETWRSLSGRINSMGGMFDLLFGVDPRLPTCSSPETLAAFRETIRHQRLAYERGPRDDGVGPASDLSRFMASIRGRGKSHYEHPNE